MVSNILAILVISGLLLSVGFGLGVLYTQKKFSQADDKSAIEEPKEPEESEPQTFFVSVQTIITDGDGNIVAEDENEFSFEA